MRVHSRRTSAHARRPGAARMDTTRARRRPPPARRSLGCPLDRVQRGQVPDDFKPVRTVGPERPCHQARPPPRSDRALADSPALHPPPPWTISTPPIPSPGRPPTPVTAGRRGGTRRRGRHGRPGRRRPGRARRCGRGTARASPRTRGERHRRGRSGSPTGPSTSASDRVDRSRLSRTPVQRGHAASRVTCGSWCRRSYPVGERQPSAEGRRRWL